MEKPHGCDLRKGRMSLFNQIYLVTTATNRRQAVFSNLYCARILIRTLMNEHNHGTTLSYVVMPDHLHWMVQLISGKSLESIVQSVKSVSSHRINKLLRHRGSIWQPGFHDHALRREEDVRRVATYVVYNPVRAGLVENIKDYAHWDMIWTLEE